MRVLPAGGADGVESTPPHEKSLHRDSERRGNDPELALVSGGTRRNAFIQRKIYFDGTGGQQSRGNVGMKSVFSGRFVGFGTQDRSASGSRQSQRS